MCPALGKEWDNISLESPVSNFNFLHHRQLSQSHMSYFLKMVLQGAVVFTNFDFLHHRQLSYNTSYYRPEQYFKAVVFPNSVGFKNCLK